MSSFLLSLLSFVINRLIDAQLFETIKALVESQMNNELSGAAKKAVVKSALTQLEGNIKEQFIKTAPNLLNLAIEAAVVIIKK
jgi:hypothetical protein